MTTTAIKQPQYIDVDFLKLNDLTAKLRIAGAKISVKKLGTLYRIILLQEPSVASVEQILSYSNSVEPIEEKFGQTVLTIAPSAIISENEESTATIPLSAEPELASLKELHNLPLEELKKLAATYKIPNRSKMSALKLAEKLHSLVTKEQLL